MKTGIPTNGSMVKNHISFKTGFEYNATRRTSFFVVPRLSTSSSSGSYQSTSRTPSRQESHSSFFKLVFVTDIIKWYWDSRKRESNWKWYLSSACVNKCWRQNGPTRCGPRQPNPKTIKKETKKERCNPLCSEIPEWLREFRENLVDDEVPERGDSHASSSHEVSSEPTFKRREDLGKHSVETHFPKDRNCEICQRTKSTIAPCRRRIGGAVPRAEIFGDLITADHKVLSEGCESRNNHRYAVGVQDLATQWIQSYPCKTKTSQESQRSLQKFLEPERKPKVIYTDNSLEFDKVWRSLLESLHVCTTQIRNKWDCWESRAVRRVKGGTSVVLLQSGLNKVGGQIPWSALPICEMFKISCLMGRHHMRDVLENQLKDRLFHLVHLLSITL